MGRHLSASVAMERDNLKVTRSLGFENYGNILLISTKASPFLELCGLFWQDQFWSANSLLMHGEAMPLTSTGALGCPFPDLHHRLLIWKNNLSLRGELFGLAEMVWRPEWPTVGAQKITEFLLRAPKYHVWANSLK